MLCFLQKGTLVFLSYSKLANKLVQGGGAVTFQTNNKPSLSGKYLAFWACFAGIHKDGCWERWPANFFIIFAPIEKKWAEVNLEIKLCLVLNFWSHLSSIWNFFLAKLRSAKWRAVNGKKLKIEKCWNVAGWLQPISRRSSSNRRQCQAYSFLRLTAPPPF